MRIYIISVGLKMPVWVNEGFQQYSKRIPENFAVELIEIAPSRRSKSTNKANAIAEEADKLLAAIPDNSHVIALDEHGKSVSTQQVSGHLEKWQMDAINPVFLIGGADGMAEKVRNRAQEIWSLSSLTFPHAMVRVILIEQIYRAWSILQNHPYHRE